MEPNYSCLIIDDEYPAHDVIKALINLTKNIEFVKSCYNGEEALKELNANSYDIVFLDINMPILTGIDILKIVDNKPAIIITSAYTNFAFDAYQYDAIDYIQKPISLNRFEKSIHKAIDAARKRRIAASQVLTLKMNGLFQCLNQDEIIYIQSFGNYIKIYALGKDKPMIINQTLVKQAALLNLDLFIQVHRTIIVNKTYIICKKEHVIVLKDNIELPIGRKFIPAINTLLL